MRQFSISTNRRYCRLWWTNIFHPHWNHNKWSVTFVVSNDCYLKPPAGKSDREINRLFGVCFGVKKDSWNIGWCSSVKENWHEIYAYNDCDTKLIGRVKANKPYSVMVESIRDKYHFTCLDLAASIDIPKSKEKKLQFPLYPSHGVNGTAKERETFFIDFNAL